MLKRIFAMLSCCLTIGAVHGGFEGSTDFSEEPWYSTLFGNTTGPAIEEGKLALNDATITWIANSGDLLEDWCIDLDVMWAQEDDHKSFSLEVFGGTRLRIILGTARGNGYLCLNYSVITPLYNTNGVTPYRLPLNVKFRLQYDSAAQLLVALWCPIDSTEWRDIVRVPLGSRQLQEDFYTGLGLTIGGYANIDNLVLSSGSGVPPPTYTRTDLDTAVRNAVDDSANLIDLLVDRNLALESQTRDATARYEALYESEKPCTIELQEGWNLVSVAVDSWLGRPATIAPTNWAWDGSSYFTVNEEAPEVPWHVAGVLIRHRGYWLYALEETVLELEPYVPPR